MTVAVEDANGNAETGDNATQVTLAIGTNPGGGTLTGGSAVTVVSGVATFSGLSISWSESATPSPPRVRRRYAPATSQPSPSRLGRSQLAFVQGPSDAPAGSAMTPAVTVAVEDASGNVETGDNSTQVSLAIGTNPGRGTLTGGSAATVTSGVATFAGLSINKAGTGYTLAASSTPTFTPATSSIFDITQAPPPAGLRPTAHQRRGGAQSPQP